MYPTLLTVLLVACSPSPEVTEGQLDTLAHSLVPENLDISESPPAPTVFSSTDGLITLGNPFGSGGIYDVSQGFGGSFSHTDAPLYHSLDIIVDWGTPLYAPRSGYVRRCEEKQSGSSAYWCHGNGRSLGIIDEASDSAVIMNHMSNIDSSLKDNDWVWEGQFVGYSGGKSGVIEEGFSTDPHLHLMVQQPAPSGNDWWIGQKTVPWAFRTDFDNIEAAADVGSGSVTFCDPLSGIEDVVPEAETLWDENVAAGEGTEVLPERGAHGEALWSDSGEPNWAVRSYGGQGVALVVSRRQMCDGGSAKSLGFPWVGWLAIDANDEVQYLPTAAGSFTFYEALADGAVLHGLTYSTENVVWKDISIEWAGGYGVWEDEGAAVLVWRHRWLRSYPWIIMLLDWNGSDWVPASDYIKLEY